MKIFLSAGDPSGDLHGSNLIKEIKKQNPDTEFYGFGGHLMAQNAEIFDLLAENSIIGFWEPVKNFSRLYEDFNRAKELFQTRRPDCVILIDYYGFNIHLAKAAKKYGIPVIYYICPQVWATRKSRVYEIKKYVDRVFVIFPFEKEIYQKAGVDCEFYGHPLLDIIPDSLPQKNKSFPNIGIMPGSRIQEIKRHFDVFMDSFKIIEQSFPGSRIIVPVFSAEQKKYITENFNFAASKIDFTEHNNYQKRFEMDVCITSSGTATVENMILGIPMVIGYRTSALTYFIAKNLIKIKHIGMVNILAGETVCRELIQHGMTSELVSKECLELLKNKGYCDTMRQKLKYVTGKLGSAGSTKKVAQKILEVYK